MKKIRLNKKIFATAFAVSAILGTTALAATDAVYSGEYVLDYGFETQPVGTAQWNHWRSYSSDEDVEATVIERSQYPDYVYEGNKAIRFTNTNADNISRGIWYRATQPWTFKKDEVYELSGWFKADCDNATVTFTIGGDATKFEGQTTKTLSKDKWTYISARYTVPNDMTSGDNNDPPAQLRIVTNLNKDKGYVYADNLSFKRVNNTTTNPKIRRIETRNGLFGAIDSSNNLWMWGESDTGEIYENIYNVENPVIRAKNVKDVCFGDGFTIVLKTDGSVWGTGRNDYGQLGTSTVTDENGLKWLADGMTKIAAGDDYSLMIDQYCNAWGMGRNKISSFKVGGTLEFSSLVKIAGNVDNIYGGDGHTFLKKTDGDFYGMGHNENSQLGLDTFLPVLQYKTNGLDVLEVCAARDYTMVLTPTETLYGFGFAPYGQMNDTTGTTNVAVAASATPRLLAENVKLFAAGEYNAFWRTSTSGLYRYGAETAGLANGTDTAQKYIARNVTAVAARDTYLYVNNNVLYDANGNAITLSEETDDTEYGLTTDGEKTTYTVNPNYDSAWVIITYYKNNRIADITITNASYDGQHSFDITNVNDADYCRIFLWHDLQTAKPLNEPELVNFKTSDASTAE